MLTTEYCEPHIVCTHHIFTNFTSRIKPQN